MFATFPKTPLQGSNTREVVKNKREKRIREALKWESGTQDRPKKNVVTTLANGFEVYFLKPGKEVFNQKRPNPQDMLPVVGNSEMRPRFDDIWSYLSDVSLVDFESFKIVLTLIYRNAYLVDHAQKEGGIIRYEPSEQILKCINEIEKESGRVSPFGLIGLLSFLDLLGWNEDMKYHTEDGRPTFFGKYNFNVGRINTLLTCIRVPYQSSMFVAHCLDSSVQKKRLDFSRLYTVMQQFAKSRGTCTPTQQQVKEWLSPYIVED